MTRSRLLGPLGARLALAFVVVALAAVATLAALTVWGTRSEVKDLVRRQHEESTRGVAAAAAQAFELGGGKWANADLSTAASLAAVADAQLEVRDSGGQLVALTSAHQQMMGDLMARMHAMGDGMMSAGSGTVGEPVAADVRSADRVVGTVTLRFAGAELPAPERQVRDSLFRVVVAGAALSALAALVVGVFVSRRLTRPLNRLVTAARTIEAGDRAVRVGFDHEPGELGELGAAFDHMADSLTREEALRRALVADVAHELRTPITILQASCEAMLDGVETPTPEHLTSLHDEVLRLGRLVADLETLSAAEAASLGLDRHAVDLADIAANASASLASRADEAGVRIDTHLDAVIVNGDPQRLHQIVVNLVANAVKFTPPQGVVTVTTTRNGSLAVLEVHDTGPGIPADEIDRVFDRFWRSPSAASISGSGIGLAVVAELVHAHRGRVEVTSEPGEGARFRVLLPQA